MTNLEVIRPFIERFITAVSNSLRLEMAIFDGSCQLFYCTPTYSKKKGRSVSYTHLDVYKRQVDMFLPVLLLVDVQDFLLLGHGELSRQP